MPDLIRHPEIQLLSDFKARVLRSNRQKGGGRAGFRLKDCRNDRKQHFQGLYELIKIFW
jgi:hypothetical protein